jgi:hypothetical protein
MEHPPYSPNLPIKFFLFPKTKEILKGRQFDDIDNIRSNTMAALKAIPQKSSTIAFKDELGAGIGAVSEGEYFEGDHSDIQQ